MLVVFFVLALFLLVFIFRKPRGSMREATAVSQVFLYTFFMQYGSLLSTQETRKNRNVVNISIIYSIKQFKKYTP